MALIPVSLRFRINIERASFLIKIYFNIIAAYINFICYLAYILCLSRLQELCLYVYQILSIGH